MNKLFRISLFVLISAIAVTACKSSSNYGKEVKAPFSQKKYKSDKKYFRASGQGASSSESVAEKKADHNAKAEMASQINSTMKTVADEFMSQSENANSAEVLEKFQSISREVVNTKMADLRKIDQKVFLDGEKYTVFVLYEIKKKDMFNFMKKQAKTQKYVDKKTQNLIEDLIDEKLEELEED